MTYRHLYPHPPGAGTRLADPYHRDGLEKAAQTLEHRPGDLGHLHGHALAGFETQARREARAAAPWAGRELRDLIATTARADEHRSRADAIAQTIDASGRRAENVLGILRRLPDLAPLRKELFPAA